MAVPNSSSSNPQKPKARTPLSAATAFFLFLFERITPDPYIFAIALTILTALLAASVTAFTIVKFAGAIYLIYLGVRLIFEKPAVAKTSGKPSEAEETRVRAAPKSLQQHFTQGFVTNVLNPKVVLFFVSFIPQFVAADSAHKTLAFLNELR